MAITPVVIDTSVGALKTLAVGNTGNVLTDNGTSWVSLPSTSGTQRTFAFFTG